MFMLFFFFCNDTATTEIYTYLHTLSLHDALPIFEDSGTTIAEHRVDPLGQIALRRRADDQRTTETKPRKLIAERSQATRREYRSSWIGLVSETQLHLNLSRP